MATKTSCSALISQMTAIQFATKQLRKTHPERRAALALMSIVRRSGDVRIADLAQHLHVGPSTISRQVDYLVKNGQIERIAQQSDGRASLLRLTAKGEAELTEVLDAFAEDMKVLLKDWPDADVKELTALLARLETSILTGIESEGNHD